MTILCVAALDEQKRICEIQKYSPMGLKTSDEYSLSIVIVGRRRMVGEFDGEIGVRNGNSFWLKNSPRRHRTLGCLGR